MKAIKFKFKFKNAKKALSIFGISQVFLGVFMGHVFLLDKVGSLDLDQLGIIASGDLGGVNINLQQLMQLSDEEVWQLLTGVPSWKPDVSEQEMDRRMVTIEVPVRTANGDSTTRVQVNQVLAELFTAFYTDLYNYCPNFYVKNYGGYNYRKVVGGSTMSAHAYGAAVDINAEENPQWTTPPKTPGSGNLAHYLIYDDHSNPVLQVAKKYTLCWGGWFNDGMHFSFTGDYSREATIRTYSTW